MKIVRHPDEMKNLSISFQRSGARIGLVPTMGALHQGHLSLVERSRPLADVSVVSIFVNPSQFAPSEDLEKYPRPFEQDCDKARECGCDVVFAPHADDMYPRHFSTHVEVERLGATLCGRARPGHFRGVSTVVTKLFNIVMPQVAVFGQKDAQQVILLKRLVRDLNMSVDIVVAPIVREPDGLAMSSRNVYLTEEERGEAPMIHKGLLEAERRYTAGERRAETIRYAVCAVYNGLALIEPEYVEIVDTTTLEPVEDLQRPALVAVACRTSQSKTRLIDNTVLGGTI